MTIWLVDCRHIGTIIWSVDRMHIGTIGCLGCRRNGTVVIKFIPQAYQHGVLSIWVAGVSVRRCLVWFVDCRHIGTIVRLTIGAGWQVLIPLAVLSLCVKPPI